MKKFTIALLGVIFVTLIAGSIQSISADHLEPGQGIFKEESEQLNLLQLMVQIIKYIYKRFLEMEMIN